MIVDSLWSHMAQLGELIAASGERFWVRWYPTRPDALPLPIPTAFFSPEWDERRDPPPHPLDRKTDEWRPKKYPAPPGTHYHGDPSWFVSGLPQSEYDHPTNAQDCQPGPIQGGGGVEVLGDGWLPRVPGGVVVSGVPVISGGVVAGGAVRSDSGVVVGGVEGSAGGVVVGGVEGSAGGVVVGGVEGSAGGVVVGGEIPLSPPAGGVVVGGVEGSAGGVVMGGTEGAATAGGVVVGGADRSAVELGGVVVGGADRSAVDVGGVVVGGADRSAVETGGVVVAGKETASTRGGVVAGGQDTDAVDNSCCVGAPVPMGLIGNGSVLAGTLTIDATWRMLWNPADGVWEGTATISGDVTDIVFGCYEVSPGVFGWRLTVGVVPFPPPDGVDCGPPLDVAFSGLYSTVSDSGTLAISFNP
jgi:hypothetical protein